MKIVAETTELSAVFRKADQESTTVQGKEKMEW